MASPVNHEFVAKDHIDKCPSLPLDCPNNCGHGKIQRKDLSDHQKECPLEPVKCPFFETGCKQEMPRKELAAHKASNIEIHLEQMMINTQCQLETMTQTARATQEKLETMIQRTARATQEKPETMTQTARATQEKLETMTQTARATQEKLEAMTQTARATQQKLEETQESKGTQFQLEATQVELKQLTLEFNALATSATAAMQLAISNSNPQNRTAIKHIQSAVETMTKITIKTALEAMTTMLEEGKQYYLPLDRRCKCTRSPSFYVKPGYKMYVTVNECNQTTLYLEKGEHDDKLEWPMPQMEITLASADKNYAIICRYFNNTKNRVQDDEPERVIYETTPKPHWDDYHLMDFMLISLCLEPRE